MKFVLSDVVQCFYLIEEDVLAIGPISGEVFENTRRRDSVFEAESLPELKSNWKRKKSKQNYANAEDFMFPRLFHSLWLPHWPNWSVIISLGIVELFETVAAP